LCSTVLFCSDDDFLTKQQYDELRRCYVSRLDFAGQSFDEALRLFLCDSGFRLPGEAQKIDRMLEAFCQRFVADNPGVFRNSCQCSGRRKDAAGGRGGLVVGLGRTECALLHPRLSHLLLCPFLSFSL